MPEMYVMKSLKPGPLIGAGIILAALITGAVYFKGSLISYISFQQAVASAGSGSTVQILGAPIRDDTYYDQQANSLNFILREPKTGLTMPVVFKSPKPDNFDEALQVTAIGHYDPESKQFEADNLLVKCPSKYAGQKTPGSGDVVPRSYASQS